MIDTITSLEFKNYKALRNYVVKLSSRNILVGPNNCGKSTIIGAFRILSEGLRRARSYSPENIVVDGYVQRGYQIPKDAIAVSMENVHTNYEDTQSSISFRLSSGNKLHLLFPVGGGCALVPEVERIAVKSPKSFISAFPITVAVVPVLGPLDHDEARVTPETVRRNLHTTRASRHFRNYWNYNPDGFERFATLVEQTWPGMSIKAPNDDGDVLHMFCTEERIPRELFWSGFGFQVWCQLLTHLDRGRDASIIVVDEPEIYLHPDLQRQLLDILFSLGPEVVLATHSAEIIGSADRRDVLLIDKTARSAQRLATDETVQQVLDSIGSLHNVTLTRIAKHRRVLFVEGRDYGLIQKLAKITGYSELSAETGLPAVPSDGFSNWTKVRDTAWGIRKILGGRFQMASILDRDFRSSEEVEYIKSEVRSQLDIAIILERKEIENYLLVPRTISACINIEVTRRNVGATDHHLCTCEEVYGAIKSVTDQLKSHVYSQYLARRTEYLTKIGDRRDQADLLLETGEWFDRQWETFDGRVRLAPGKEVLSKLRDWAQERFKATLTTSLILGKLKRADISNELVEVFESLDMFRRSREPDQLEEPREV